MTTLAVVRRIVELRRAIAAWRQAGASVGLVPTMGALHDGHLALVKAAEAACDRVVATIFVNPKQFGAGEDLAAYPRNEAEDVAKLDAHGVDLVFAPDAREIYPPGFATTVTVAGLTEGLCGARRPGHFAGVATVVTKLLIQALPDRAYFGEKDYQQLLVIRRLARDLDVPVAIEGVATVREPDGMALSSRNAYLSPEQRRIAVNLSRVLREVAGAVARGAPVAAETARGLEALAKAGFDSVDYLEVRDAETLEPVDAVTPSSPPARVFAAARIGATRLIDNMPVAAG